MQAIVQAGGEGIRLRPHTSILPKPLLPLGDTPLIDVLLHGLVRVGFDDIIVITCYKHQLVESVVKQKKYPGIKLRFYQELTPLSTVGVLPMLRGLADDFILVNADILTVLNFRRLLEFHQLSGRIMTMAVLQRKERIDLGIVQVGKDNTVVDYVEKPVHHFNANMGCYAFNKRIVAHIPKGKPMGIDDLIYVLLQDKQDIGAFVFAGYWRDCGRIDDFEIAAKDYQDSPQLFEA